MYFSSSFALMLDSENESFQIGFISVSGYHILSVSSGLNSYVLYLTHYASINYLELSHVIVTDIKHRTRSPSSC